MNSSPSRKDESEDRYHAPQGTLALLLVYLALIIVCWAGVYLTMLGRGTTQ